MNKCPNCQSQHFNFILVENNYWVKECSNCNTTWDSKGEIQHGLMLLQEEK